MAFSFADLLKKQFPLAGVEAYTGSPKRMPESSPFPNTSALGALGMGGLVDALGGVSMADYFNNDNWETRQVEGVSKRGEMVDRQYRMSPGDKKTIKVGNDGKIVETTERTTGDLFSEQPNMSSPPSTSAETYPLGEGPVGDSTAIFRNEQVGMMPIDSIPPRRSTYNRPNEYDRMSRMNPGMGGPLSSMALNNPYMPIEASSNPYTSPYVGNADAPPQFAAQQRIPTNTVYPRPTTRSMYNRPNEYQRMASMPTSFDGPGIRAQPVQPGMQNDIDSMMMSNDLSRMIPPSLLDTAQSEMFRMPTLVAQGEDGAFPPIGPNVYGLDEGMFNEDPDDERRRLLGELLREYYQTNGRTYTSGGA